MTARTSPDSHSDLAATRVRASRRKMSWFSGILTLGIAAGLVAVGGVAHAATAGDINACVAKDGTIRIVGDPAECKKVETLLAWNQEGPAGPKGDQGEPGEQGPAGAPGGLAGYGISVITVDILSDHQSGVITVQCAEGKKAVNGGIKLLEPDGSRADISNWGFVIRYSDPLPDGSGWEVSYRTSLDTEAEPLEPGHYVEAYAVCATAN